MKEDNFSAYRIPRERMLEEQVIGRNITDTKVIHAMRKVMRHEFIPKALVHTAYEDIPVHIGYGQTISQPYTVALMSQSLELEKGMTVLEIGMGSGYQAAVLHEMGAYVFTVERIKELYFETKERFQNLGYSTIRTSLSDGTLGWQEMAPFDRILVAAGGPNIPQSLIEQLADGGIMIVPVGTEKREQELIKVVRQGDTYTSKVLCKTSFVDLVGKEGW